MAMITYPLNDVEYTAEDAELYNCTRSSGVYSGEDFSCAVSGTNNNVTISEGIGWIKNGRFSGKVFANKTPVTLALDIADAAYPRIDVIAVRFDAATNSTDFVIKKGEASAAPVMPAMTQTETIYELYLYSIYRPAAAVTIGADDVTDLRLDESYCGLMADAVTSVDTSVINAQFTALLEKIKQELADLKVGKVDAYTKEETFSSSTKTALGLSEDAVPNDAFASLGWHAWRRRAETVGLEPVLIPTVKDSLSLGSKGDSYADTVCTIYYSDTYTESDYVFTLANYETFEVNANNAEQLKNAIRKKYFLVNTTSSETLYYGGGHTYTTTTGKDLVSGYFNYWIKYLTAYTLEYKKYDIIGEYEYVTSPNRHAYPDSGREGIFTYEYLGAPLENAKEAYGMRLHWWKRRTEESGYVISQNIGGAQFAGDSLGQLTFLVYDSLSINAENGEFILGTAASITSNYSDANYFIKNMKGKYFCQENGVDYYYCDSDTTASKNGTTKKLEFFNVVKLDSILKTDVGTYEYLSSPNRNAYPDSGTEGIFSYQYLAVPFENAREGAKIVTGSYVGTGTYGEANPCSLTFNFAPKMVIMMGYKPSAASTYQFFGSLGGSTSSSPSSSNLCFRYVMYSEFLSDTYTLATGFQANTGSFYNYGKKSEDGKTFSWYHSNNASNQMNYSGYTYYYVAIG